MRAFLFPLSFSVDELNWVEQAASNLDCIVHPFENLTSLGEFLLAYGSGIVILHCRGNLEDCLDQVRQISIHSPNCELIVMNSSWTGKDSVKAVRSGATDIVDLPCSNIELTHTLQNALVRFHKKCGSKILGIPVRIQQSLSPQENSIFTNIVRGLTIKQISSELDLSIRTVQYRFKDILRKLGVANRTEAIELLRKELGLIDFGYEAASARPN